MSMMNVLAVYQFVYFGTKFSVKNNNKIYVLYARMGYMRC